MAEIGTLNESPLHAALKAHLAEPGDLLEHEVDGFVIDIFRGGHLIEVQTRHFAGMGAKLDRLLDRHQVTLVYPIPVRTMLHRPGQPPRRSPVRRTIYDLFGELVSIPTLIDHPGLTVTALLIEEIQHKIHDPSLRRGRGGWRVAARHLGTVSATESFRSGEDLCALLPPGLPDTFTTADIAAGAGTSRSLAQKMAYCLRLLGQIQAEDRGRSGVRYRMAPPPADRGS